MKETVLIGHFSSKHVKTAMNRAEALNTCDLGVEPCFPTLYLWLSGTLTDKVWSLVYSENSCFNSLGPGVVRFPWTPVVRASLDYSPVQGT